MSVATASNVRRWIMAGYERRPALVVGLAGVLLLPPLLLLGLVVHRRQAEPVMAVNDDLVELERDLDARIELEGAGVIVLPKGRPLVQIGRQEDNDICIADETVEHYHAVIERQSERGFSITDVSGAEGNGVRINGAWCSAALLADGDLLELGNARMRFAIAA